MRVYVHKRDSGGIEFGIIYGVIALIGLCAARFPQIITLSPSCVFQVLLGIPCPTCGSTRAVLHLSHGEIIAALAFNPLISSCFLAAVLYFLYSIIAIASGMPRIGCTLSEGDKNTVSTGVVILVLMNWMYLIRTL
jgi:hypothetical protein